MFDDMHDKLLSYFTKSGWIRIDDKYSKWTIEDFPYDTGVPDEGVDNHCWRCVTVNHCWFKNEEMKKPKEFDYGEYSYTEIPKAIRGLYHPNCHCKEHSINTPREKDITILKYEPKLKDFFTRKLNWFYSWGYLKSNKQTFAEYFKQNIISSYRRGNYVMEKHTRYGFQINVFLTIPGINSKAGKYYFVKSAYIVYPSGRLKCVTLVGGV